jgi:hypothetical protein
MFFGVTGNAYTEICFQDAFMVFVQVNTLVHIHHLLQQVGSVAMPVGRRHK